MLCSGTRSEIFAWDMSLEATDSGIEVSSTCIVTAMCCADLRANPIEGCVGIGKCTMPARVAPVESAVPCKFLHPAL